MRWCLVLALVVVGGCRQKQARIEPETISGGVQRSAGGITTPAADCEVRGFAITADDSSPDVVGRTDARGQFTLRGTRADRYYVFATCGDDWGGGGREAAGTSGPILDLTVAPGLVVYGVVRDKAGQPLAGVAVRAMQSAYRGELGYSPRMHTGADGRYRLGGLSEGFGFGAHLGDRETHDLVMPRPIKRADGVGMIELDLTL
jgi:hypothetical protein